MNSAFYLQNPFDEDPNLSFMNFNINMDFQVSQHDSGSEIKYLDIESPAQRRHKEDFATGLGIFDLPDHDPPSEISFMSMHESPLQIPRRHPPEVQLITASGSIFSTKPSRAEIEVNPWKTELVARERKGRRSETKNLGANMHKITSNFLIFNLECRQLLGLQIKETCQIFCNGSLPRKQTRQSQGDQKEAIGKESNVICQFRTLFDSSPSIAQMCVNMYSSKRLVVAILGSKMSMENKLVGIKYMQRMRKLPLVRGMVRWKQ